MRDSRYEKRRKTNYFHNAIHQYGEDNFSFIQIDTAESQSELDEKEKYWIGYYNSTDKNVGYNLDSGGQKGGCKSDITKQRIGTTTKQKWQNPETARKMRDGLRKGTETCKKNAKSNFIEYMCPNCHKTMLLKPWQVKNRTACSIKCAAAINKEKNDAHLREINIKNQEKFAIHRTLIKDFIIQWCKNNQEVVMNCPLNKITTSLQPLIIEIEKQYGIKDIRSITLCFNITSRKEFLKYLQQLIST